MRKFLIAAAAALLSLLLPVAAMAENLVARIDLSNQTMTVSKNGMIKYRWKVSTARRGYTTPVGAYTAKWASRHHRSRKYNNAPMPFAIFFKGGYAVHATYDLKRLGRPASHGCIRLHPNDAAKFYALAHQAGLRNTKIQITR